VSNKSQNNAKKATPIHSPTVQSTDAEARPAVQRAVAQKDTSELPVATRNMRDKSIRQQGQSVTEKTTKQSSSLLPSKEPNINEWERQMAVAALVGGGLLILAVLTGVLDFTSVFFQH